MSDLNSDESSFRADHSERNILFTIVLVVAIEIYGLIRIVF